MVQKSELGWSIWFNIIFSNLSQNSHLCTFDEANWILSHVHSLKSHEGCHFIPIQLELYAYIVDTFQDFLIA